MNETILSMLETLGRERPDRFFFSRYAEDPRYEMAEDYCWTFQDSEFAFGVYDWQDRFRDWLIYALASTPIKVVWQAEGLTWDESILQAVVLWHVQEKAGVTG